MNTRPDYLPSDSETCVASHPERWKRDALLFDRVYVSRTTPNDPNVIPDQITFGANAVDLEIQVHASERTSWWFSGAAQAGATDVLKIDEVSEMADAFGQEEGHRAILDRYGSMGFVVTPTYGSKEVFMRDFSEGQVIAYAASFRNLPMVDSRNVTWEQVLEFRKDTRASGAYRDLRIWLQSGLKASTVDEASDIISQRIDDYRWSIRKHGFDTFIGTLSSVIELKKTLAASSAGALATTIAGPVWGALISGSVMAGSIFVELAEKHLGLEDLKRGKNREVALIYKAHQEFSQVSLQEQNRKAVEEDVLTIGN